LATDTVPVELTGIVSVWLVLIPAFTPTLATFGSATSESNAVR
jgi:hypothetical protein